jgi:hypothetical protein
MAEQEKEVITEIPGYWRLPKEEREEMLEFMRERKKQPTRPAERPVQPALKSPMKDRPKP